METSILSLLPPVLALVMVIITRRVLLSLGIGIVVGALLLHQFNPIEALANVYGIFVGIFFSYGDIEQVTFQSVTEAVFASGFALNTWELFIILFLLLLGMLAALVTFSGGSRAFGEWAIKRVKTRRGAQLLTVILGVIVFIDDYFNSLTVGNVSRPLTDRHQISRAKLAYLVDSTAAPICVIAPVSSWGAYIIAIIAGILATHGVTEYEALQAFILMIPMNIYAVVAMLLVFSVAMFNLNIGLMKTHETAAMETGQLVDPKRGPVPGDQEGLGSNRYGTVGDLVWPILALVISTVFFMVWTGLQASEGQASLLAIFENTDVATSLVYGGVVGLVVTLLLNCVEKARPIELLQALREGIKSMLPAIYILLAAWVIIAIIDQLGTGEYLAIKIEEANLNPMFLPAILFVVAGFAAFSTGTSWGTFGLLLPIAGEMAAVLDITLMLPMLAAVLAGSIFGDHCSPISDTTILSSTGAGSHHIDHVITQLPYALLGAVITFISYLILGVTMSVSLALVSAVMLLAICVFFIRKKNGYRVNE
ncbi:Na+/H+ antiporter NhaC family protein [Halalkalibacter urbisdiaboli]|uniref:Na+/H+ antiporter NhaC family protein n=1 Tax=Halalkalibacter urbisdiaboli TaxID=1960589 RepID=UPI000B4340B3|nr:Na+/H+ antiporter NhaC family protein [Halalkalibacter urbisdiaboli]